MNNPEKTEEAIKMNNPETLAHKTPAKDKQNNGNKTLTQHKIENSKDDKHGLHKTGGRP
jgi:hypothetical protein